MDKCIAAANDGLYQQQACRTLPIPTTVTPVAGYPAKLKIYLTNASQYWQVRCFFQGRVRTRTLRTTNKREALANAKQFYEELVGGFYAKKICWEEQASPASQFEMLVERVILLERDRVARGDLAEMTHRANANRLRQYWMPLLGDKHINVITHYDIMQAVGILSRRGISSVSLTQYLQSLRSVFALAQAERLIAQPPIFPKIRKDTQARGGFSVDEYRLIVQTARRLTQLPSHIKSATHRNRAGGIYTKTDSVPLELPWLIGFMVNGFMRPSDIIQIQHQHVEVVRGVHVYLRLTLPETKRHKIPIVTLRPAVRIYERLHRHMELQGMAKPNDYLFLPTVRNRTAAGPILSQHFNKVLEAAGLRTGQLGQARTLYSLRHTAIMFRLLYGKGIDLLTLARNARTSVQMIEKFYASQLTAEMNIGLLQSRR